MKLILVIIILVCFGMIGFGLAKYYFSRKKFFENLNSLAQSMKSNIQFSQDKLKKIIQDNSSKTNCDNIKILCDNYITDLEKSTEKDLFKNISILKDEEKTIISNFFSSLGKFDSTTQVMSITNYNTKFEEFYEQAKYECNKYASLFVKLSIVAGTLVCLLII